MPGTICAAGSLAPPSRTTIFRGVPSRADAVRLRRFLVPLAEPASIFFFATLSDAFFSAAGVCGLADAAGMVSAGTCSAGAASVCDFSAGAFSAGAGAAGACPAAFVEPAGSCCREAIPAAGKLSQSAIASPQASRITVTKRLFPTLTKNASVLRRSVVLNSSTTKDTKSPPGKTGEAFPLPRLVASA